MLRSVDTTSVPTRFRRARSISFTRARCSCPYPRAWRCCDGSSRGWLPMGGWCLRSRTSVCGSATLTRCGPAHLRRPKRPFPSLALSPGGSLLRQVHQVGLTDVGVEAEIDIIQAGTDLAEFTGSARLRSPVLRCRLGPSMLPKRRHSPSERPTMISSRADSSTSAYGASDLHETTLDLGRSRDRRAASLASAVIRRDEQGVGQ